MKRFAIIGLIIVALSGCKFLSGLREDILQKGGEVVEGVTKTVENVGTQVEKTKKSVEQKVEDLENAAREVQEAVDAVKKVTGSQEETGTTTN